MPDHVEEQEGTDPNDPDDSKDSDGDGVPDYVEEQEGTDPNEPGDAKDSDGDGVPDHVEGQEDTDPTDPGDKKDSDGDGVPDHVEDQEGTDRFDSKNFKDSTGDGIPDYILFRSIESIESAEVVLLWGDEDYLSKLPISLKVKLYSGAELDMEMDWNAKDVVNIYKNGTYTVNGQPVLPRGLYNSKNRTAILRVIVLPKPAPLDVTLTNSVFVGDERNFFIEVGAFQVTDPVDNIHEVTLYGPGYDNQYFEIKDNILFWSSADPAEGKTTFTIIVRVTDRDGNTLDKFFEISRIRQDINEIEVFNAFTPDGDGINDTWGIPEIRFYRGARVQVFERSGERVFYTEDPDVRWDGTYKGKELPVGTYFWVLELKETGETRRGMLNLIRK